MDVKVAQKRRRQKFLLQQNLQVAETKKMSTDLGWLIDGELYENT